MTTIDFDKKVTCGPEFIALRILDNCEQIKAGNIWIPSTAATNERLAFGVIENIGADAAKEYGLKIGDYVLFDRLSSFYHTSPVCVIKYNNVICLTNKDRTEYHPLKNMLFVEPPKDEDVTCQKGVFVLKNDKTPKIGTVIDMNVEDENLSKLSLKVNDKVLVTKGGDQIRTLNGDTVTIYKWDMILCRIDD